MSLRMYNFPSRTCQRDNLSQTCNWFFMPFQESLPLSFFIHRGIHNVNIPQISGQRLMTHNVEVIFSCCSTSGNLIPSVLWRELSLITYLLRCSLEVEWQAWLYPIDFLSHVLLFYLHHFPLSYTLFSSANMRFIATHWRVYILRLYAERRKSQKETELIFPPRHRRFICFWLI